LTSNVAKPRPSLSATPVAKTFLRGTTPWPLPWFVNPWNFGAGVVFLILHVVLDRMTVDFQMWKGVSAWYPPAGLEVAVLVGLGFSYMPVILVANFVSAIVNYHQSPRSAAFRYQFAASA